MKIDDFKDSGMIYFTESAGKERATNFANTYVFNTGGRDYIIDTSCGDSRYRELKKFLRQSLKHSILCTHYHNDHIANNGRLSGHDAPIVYHENATSKVAFLRTNGTGQIIRMYRDMQKDGFLKRLGFFNDTFIRLLLKRTVYSKYVGEPLLFVMSYIFSLKSIGRIYTGKKHVRYLRSEDKTLLPFSGIEVYGWKIDDSLYAIETPGHTDCHIMFYLRGSRVLAAGDALNFLTPNDIQFGDLKSTIESQKLILEIAEDEGIEILCQGHYPPVTGNEVITGYIKDIIAKHEHVYRTVSSFISENGSGLSFDELYKKVCSIDDPVINKLTRITFPRSTLVFLDVYLLKMIEELQLNPDDSRPGRCLLER